MLSAVRTGARSARSTTAAVSHSSLEAAAAVVPRNQLCARAHHSSGRRGLFHRARRAAANRPASLPTVSRRTIFSNTSGKAFAVGGSGGSESRGDGKENESGSDSDSDSSDSSDDEEEAGVDEKSGAIATPRGKKTGRGRRGPSAEAQTPEVTPDEEAEDLGVVWDDADEGELESRMRAGEGGDYHSVGREIFEGGDLEAGDTLRGMYDFVDDIVETQQVPTIKDPFDHKGRFHRCRGKKQGKAALPGTCEIFDVKELHVNNAPLLKRFLNDTAMVLGRDRTGLCAKCQRKVSRTIKASRQMGFLPTISDFEIRDTGPGGLYAWAAKDGDHDAMAKAKAVAEARLKKDEKKRFGSLV